MSITEALLGTDAETKSRRIIETASAVARTDGLDAAEEESVSLGAAEAGCLTLTDLEQQEAEAWREFKIAEAQMEATPMGMRLTKLRSKWYAIMMKSKSVAAGCSRRAVPCGQAEHLRQVVADGAK